MKRPDLIQIGYTANSIKPPYPIGDEYKTQLYYAAKRLMKKLPTPYKGGECLPPTKEINEVKEAYNKSTIEDSQLLEVVSPFAEGEYTPSRICHYDPEVVQLYVFFNGEGGKDERIY